GRAWVADATTAEVVADSDRQVLATYRVLCGDTTGLYPAGRPPVPQGPFVAVPFDDDSLPIFAAGAGRQEVLLCDYRGQRAEPNAKWGVTNPGGPVEVPACTGTVRPAGPTGFEGDGHLVLVDPTTDTAYDFRQATTERLAECQSRGAGRPGSAILEAGQADFADYTAAGANPRGVVGARPSGIPLLAGAILPEDLESGAIGHALALAIPGPRNLSPAPSEPLASDVVYPAAGTDPEGYSTNPDALAAGQRLRLKGSLVNASGLPVNETSAFAPVTRMVLAALRTHGAYVVGDAPGLTLFTEDVHTAAPALTPEEVNLLVGQPAGSPLPTDRTPWQYILERLNQDLAQLPFAHGSCTGTSSVVLTANFDVVTPAEDPNPCTAPAITAEPEDATVSSGGSATLTVTATGTEPLTFQWYAGSSGDTSIPVAGATAASYTTPALTETTSYWVRVSNDCGFTDSSTATVTVSDVGDLDELYFVAAAGNAAGGGSSLWATDVEVSNPGAEAIAYRILWLPRDADNSDPTESEVFTLPAGASVRSENVLGSVFGVTGFGALAVAADSTDAVVMSRTYNISADGTFGQSIVGLEAARLIHPGERRRIVFMSEDEAFRAHLGMLNGTAAPMTVRYRLHDADGALLREGSKELRAWENTQLNRVFQAFAPVSGYVDVWTDTPGGAFAAYGSVVDAGTGDPTTVMPETVNPAELYLVAAAGNAAGGGSSQWATDVEVNNPGAAAVTYRFLWLPRDADNSDPVESEAFALPAGASVRHENVLDSVFGLTGFGALAVVTDPAGAIVTSRTFNISAAGTFGQSIVGLDAARLIHSGEHRRIVFMSEDDDFRANLGMLNGTDAEITVRYRLFDADGAMLREGSEDLLPFENTQLNRVFLAFAPVSGSVEIWTETPGGAFAAYGSVVDAGTSDPTTIMPE
ncbi:MAG: hypothetical protein MUE34_13305, partial [Acidimicrobiales bacterium]|nr:hypothetical protein [Acidimicrobiales bacterium]